MNLNLPDFQLPEIPDMPHHHMWADEQFEIIKRYVQNFEDSLDDEREVGLLLTNFGQSVLLHVQQIGYEKSVMMVYKGLVDGKPATLLQHMNQINFLLTAVDRPEPEQPKRPIGF